MKSGTLRKQEITDFIPFWYQAMAETIGIVLETDNPDLAVRRLFAARDKAMDTQLADLTVIKSRAVETQVWVVKKQFEVSENGGESIE